MSSEHDDIYVMLDREDEDWLRPMPVAEVITDAVVTNTDLGRDDLQNLDQYVDWGAIQRLVDDEDDTEHTFSIEGHDVTVDADGSVRVD